MAKARGLYANIHAKRKRIGPRIIDLRYRDGAALNYGK